MLTALLKRPRTICAVLYLRRAQKENLVYVETCRQRRATLACSHMDKFLVKKRPAADVLTAANDKGESKKVMFSDQSSSSSSCIPRGLRGHRCAQQFCKVRTG